MNELTFKKVRSLVDCPVSFTICRSSSSTIWKTVNRFRDQQSRLPGPRTTTGEPTDRKSTQEERLAKGGKDLRRNRGTPGSRISYAAPVKFSRRFKPQGTPIARKIACLVVIPRPVPASVLLRTDNDAGRPERDWPERRSSKVVHFQLLQQPCTSRSLPVERTASSTQALGRRGPPQVRIPARLGAVERGQLNVVCGRSLAKALPVAVGDRLR